MIVLVDRCFKIVVAPDVTVVCNVMRFIESLRLARMGTSIVANSAARTCAFAGAYAPSAASKCLNSVFSSI